MAEIKQLRTVFHNRFSARTDFEMRQGSRPWHMLLILSEGSFSYTVGSKQYTVEKNEIAFFPAHTHFERQILSPIDFHQFGFFLTDDMSFLTLPEAGKLKLPPKHVRAVIELLDCAVRFYPHDEEAVYDHLLYHILLEHTLFSAEQNRPPLQSDNDIAEAIQYMTEHIGEKISIRTLADHLHLSHVGLVWKFRQKMNCTPSDFLIRLRMQYAKQLLLDGDKQIREIAELCGSRNAYYFSNAFKQHFHMSPSDYRKSRTKR